MRYAFFGRHARGLVAMGIGACVAACQGSGPPEKKTERQAAAPAVPADVAVVEVGEVTGLSGLAVDGRGTLWMVPERKDMLIERTAGGAPRTWPMAGAPDEELDFESLAWLGNTPDGRERFAVGTEAICERNTHAVLIAERQGEGFRVVETLRLSLDLWPETVCEDGHGLEGLCAALTPQGEAFLVAAIEHPEVNEQKQRYAPVAVLAPAEGAPGQPGQLGQTWTPYRVALTSATGKLSALDCRLAAEGPETIEVWAIERHFEISRLVRFVVPARAGAGQAQGETGLITPTVVMDLSPYTNDGKRNFEGVSIVDGRVHVLVDNHWRSISGPNELLSLPLPSSP